eukprot:1054252-Prymnesium_polylepis.1
MSARQRWEAERLDRAPKSVRERARHLPSDASASSSKALEHNTWDDVEHDTEELRRAEELIVAQAVAPEAVAEGCAREAARRWDEHYACNLRNYHDRKYLHNEFAQLRPPLGAVVILESGCGVGNTLLPLLAAHPEAQLVGCDLSPIAVHCVNERLSREKLESRGRAFVWDIAAAPPVPELQPAALRADLALAVFTLSALPPDRLGAAFANLYNALRPGGRLLFRDYGRLDSKQLKFCRAANGRIGGGGGLEWYARGDGTTAVFFTLDVVRHLAADVGFEVDDLRYDRRCATRPLVHNSDCTRRGASCVTAPPAPATLQAGRQPRAAEPYAPCMGRR